MEEMIFAWIVFLILIILNCYSFLLFRHDKKLAIKNRWRVSENKLLLAALLGPFGAYASMKRYRHKTRRFKFKLIPVLMVLQIVLLVVALCYLF